MFSVLHVDYNFFYKEILKDVSVQKDFQYFSAKTPLRAFEILKDNKIDLIITGLEFKEGTGEDFIRHLMQSEYRHIPIIVLSSTDDVEVKTKLLNLGILDYLTKDTFIEYLTTYISKIKTEDFAATQLRNLKIAVLDDIELHLDKIRDMFQHNNISNVDYYTHAEDLLNSKEEYSIYLIDCILPTILGEQVIWELRGRNQYAVIIAVSCVNSHAIISNILSTGADDYIIKPFSENIFMARLKANIRTFYLLEQLKEKNLKLEQMVKIDGLTGLFNHKYVMENLEKEMQRARRYNTALSVVMLDIDKFKLVNDTYGHQVGDQVLIQISEYLQKNSREIDITGRYGGEEFIIILPGLNLQDTYIIVERLRIGISQIQFSEKKIKITISGGITEFQNETPLELVKKSDTLLYNAKKNGRNRIEK